MYLTNCRQPVIDKTWIFTQLPYSYFSHFISLFFSFLLRLMKHKVTVWNSRFLNYWLSTICQIHFTMPNKQPSNFHRKNRESDLKSTPIWARCSRSNDQKNKAWCGIICNCAIQYKIGSTTAMITHLKKWETTSDKCPEKSEKVTGKPRFQRQPETEVAWRLGGTSKSRQKCSVATL